MSKILVLGVDHFLQNIESVCTNPLAKEWEAKQKASLVARLEELVSARLPQLIAEEAKLDRDCLGKQIADSHGCKYCNLSMPCEDRSKAGVAKDYDRRPETRRIAYEIFEAFMFEQVQKNRKDANTILVICGSYHVFGLAKLLRNAGDEVETEDTYDAEWYRGIPEESGDDVIGFFKEMHGR
jgi:hypothetical protein